MMKSRVELGSVVPRAPSRCGRDTRRQCARLQQAVERCPDLRVERYFDPHHNAVKNYYLVRGDLAGSWKDLINGDRRELEILTNGMSRSSSFADQGHAQLIAGYLMATSRRLRSGLSPPQTSRNVGIMYTTWA